MGSGTAFETLKASTPTISVGVLTADLMSLGTELALLEQTDVKMLHFDVMDGCFCPSMTVGPPFIKAVKTVLLKDVHLLIADPLEKVADYVAAGADIVTVHLESGRHVHRVLQALGGVANANDPERWIVRGVGLNPGTPVGAVEPLLGEVEMIVLLGINPGWGGQKLIGSTRDRLLKARSMIRGSGRDILLCLDGGITRNNIVEVAAMGADVVVTGSAVFDGKDPVGNARFMLDALRR